MKRLKNPEEEAVEETVAGSTSEDFYDEVEADVIADESGVNEDEDEMEMEPEMDGEELKMKVKRKLRTELMI